MRIIVSVSQLLMCWNGKRLQVTDQMQDPDFFCSAGLITSASVP